MNTFHEDYSRGMDMLLLSNPAFATLVRSIGVPEANESIPTAQVSFDVARGLILFEINPAFIAPLSDGDIAAVIAHETYHVLLDHLSELQDEAYPVWAALIHAQECIINDGLPGNVGFAALESACHGPELYNQDFSIFTTKQGYDFILKQTQEPEPEEDDEGEAEQEAGEQGQGSPNASTAPADGPSSGAAAGGSAGGNASSQEPPQTAPADEPGEEEQASEGAGVGASSEAEADEDANGSGGDASPQDGQPEGACGGVQITGEGDLQDAKDILAKALQEAAKELQGMAMSGELSDLLDQAMASATNGTSPSFGFTLGQDKSGFATTDVLSGLNANWADLLLRINPKLRTAGRAKHKDSWRKPRRRMMHSYPQIILPTRERLEGANDEKGDSVPTFVVALDMSPSIPTALLKVLAGFALSIPQDKIRAFPITWSSGVRVFDPENPSQIVTRSGTNPGVVWDYAEKIKKETGVQPYVLCITDGEYTLPSTMRNSTLTTHWSWLATSKNLVREVKRHSHVDAAKVWAIQDFI